MDVGEWLRSFGLSQYETTFRENGVDADVLLDLTDADLKKLGVLLGHRKRLLKAIANLGAVASAKVAAEAAPLRPEVDAAERRHVTVMFIDLVGSTSLSTRMDPEDLRDIIATFQRCVSETVRSFDGFVAKYLGDGVLAYFGYPLAHEDDAERAVRAGLELVAAVAALKSLVSLQARVGIATGLVVVGDMTGSGEAQERGIVGETPNLAARLQVAAQPNTVVIAEGTRKLLGNIFELEGLGARELKGLAGRSGRLSRRRLSQLPPVEVDVTSSNGSFSLAAVSTVTLCGAVTEPLCCAEKVSWLELTLAVGQPEHTAVILPFITPKTVESPS